MKNAKRIVSIVLCVMMTLSMLTAIVLPVSAATPASVAERYAKITTKTGTNEPTDNVFFFDFSWDKTEGDEFEYKYTGNGVTYSLEFGKNACKDWEGFRTAIAEYTQ